MGFRKAASPRTKRASEPSASCWRHSTPVTCFLKGKCTIVTHKGARGLPRGSSGTRESLTLPLVPTVRSGPRARASPAPKPQSSWPLGTPLSSWMFQRKVRGHCRVTDAQMLTLEAVPTGSPHLSLSQKPCREPIILSLHQAGCEDEAASASREDGTPGRWRGPGNGHSPSHSPGAARVLGPPGNPPASSQPGELGPLLHPAPPSPAAGLPRTSAWAT